jgi:hypothetical protein
MADEQESKNCTAYVRDNRDYSNAVLSLWKVLKGVGYE